MDYIDETMIYPLLKRGRDKADSSKHKLPKNNQLNIIMEPFWNLNLLQEHGMMVTEESRNKIPHVSQVSNLPDPDYEVPEVQKWWREGQKPNNKTYLSQGIRRTRDVSQVHEPQPKDVIGYQVPMSTKREQDAWRKFQERAERDNWAGRECIRLNCDEVVLDHDEPIVQLLARFAVDTYNAICMKARVSDGVRMTSILEFKYIKRGDRYVNYITIEAAEFGINCKYQSLVYTVPSDGRKTMVNFHRARGWLPFDDISDNDALKRKNDPEEVARWTELKEERKKFLKAVRADRIMRTMGSGLVIDYVLGSYSYYNPLKEFRKLFL